MRVADDDKRAALYHLIREQNVRQAFIFNNSKLGCARLARNMERDGYKTAALHGDKSQDERLKALEAFKAGEVEFLVCTDVAARGLDIKDVPVVFNFDIPFNAEEGWHVPKIIYNQLVQRECQVFYTVKNARGQSTRKGKLIKEFAIEVLPQLTEKELTELARRQAMAKAVD